MSRMPWSRRSSDSSVADSAGGARPCRVWILNHYADTPDRPAGTRHYSLARAVVRHGGDVTVFAASRFRWTGKDERGSRWTLARTQHVEGVRFVWLWTIPYYGNTWRRIANMLSYAVIVCVAQAGRPAPDVVVGSTVHPFAALAGWFIATLRGARFIYEVRDLWPQTLIDLGAIAERSLPARGLAMIEAFLVRRAQIVITLLPGMSTYLTKRGLPASHVRYLPNGADLDIGSRSPSTSSEAGVDVSSLFEDLARRRRRGEVVFAYVGSHGQVNRLDVVLSAHRLASGRTQRPIAIYFIGDGPEKPALERLALTLDVPNVVFAKPVPKNLIPAVLEAVDVGVVHATTTAVYQYGVSFNKVFDYMAAARPIAFACTTANDPVAAAGAGLSVPPDDPAALAEAMVKLAESSPEDRGRMGAAGRAFVEREHDMARIGDRFAEIVGCVREPRSSTGPDRASASAISDT